MKFETKVIHGGIEPEKSTGAVMTPIFQTSTFAQEKPGKHKGFEYARTHNPTRSVLEKNLAILENGIKGFAFASGLAATDAVIKLLEPNDEVICVNDLYGGTYRLFDKIYSKFGIKFKFIDFDKELKNLESKISKKTKLIWIETPTNPLLKIIDIKKVSDLIKDKNILLAVDNTFASPYIQNPLTLGADIVVHSVTKYISGHSDVIMGAVVVKNNQIADKIEFIQNGSGAVPSPNDCFLVLRGIKTLHLRMDRQSENAEKIVSFLKNNKNVSEVFYPGIKESENYVIAKSQMKNFGAMLSFKLKNADKQKTFEVISKFKLFTIAESLGGVESLVGHPASMTHASIPLEERLKSGVTDNLIRLSVGVENVEDLTEDLYNVLK